MTARDRTRVPAGTPSGGRFAPTERDEAPVALEVEFARDEAEQVDRALHDHCDEIVALAVANSESPSFENWTESDREAWVANQSARAAMFAMRLRLGGRDFATRIFAANEVEAMSRALSHRRSNRPDPVQARVLEAARFRLGIAQPLIHGEPE